ncbi:hypothetical protein FE634_21820 [Nocardioides dongxiaopingii]|uniref:hypothetical protein n=1 Tax=Nocardioides sp. S-1144 TaxID=2582905 RepID=UPI00116524F0|nr:hypothetical protein [Nocardioides sp. S-1144]QDH10971.1 hypothetical protein FE634_21820 [Nocardioides sp. S-1144]
MLRATLMYDQWDRAFGGCLEVDERLWGSTIHVAGEEYELSGADLRVPIPTAESASALLSRGESWALRPGLTLRLAPTSAVVLHEDPLLGALVQVRGSTAARSYTVLVRDDLIARVTEALADQAPLNTVPVGSEVSGWTWIRAVRPTADSAELRALGLGSLAIAASSPLALDGGLQLEGRLYLTGGEPDIVAPDTATIILDGREIHRPHRPEPSRQTLNDQIESSVLEQSGLGPSDLGPSDVGPGDQATVVGAGDGPGDPQASAADPGHETASEEAAVAVAASVRAGSVESRGSSGRAVTIRLADLYLDPGDHEVLDEAGRTVTFSTVAHIRETPDSGGRWSSVLDALAPQPANVTQTTSVTPVLRASGALATTLVPQGEAGRIRLPPPRQATGASSLRMLRSRVWPNRRALVLREDGSLVEVFPDTEPWLGEIGLRAATVDVLRTVRSMDPRPVLFIEYAARAARCIAVEIPSDAVLMPGQVPWMPATDLVGAVASATWQADPSADAARRRLLSLALQQARSAPVGGRQPSDAGRVGSHVGRQPGRQPSQSGTRTPAAITSAPAPAVFDPRDDVLSDAWAQNPYDDVLGWLCERRSASASMASFAQAWSWACERYGLTSIADRSRLAISRLSDLGFIEPDWSRHRINAAPACLIELPASSGLLLLAGARPPRLLERIVDDEDANEAVAHATGLWTIHRRVQTIDDLPAAPTAIYLELDTAHTPDALDGLAALGVHTTADPASRILASLPAAAEISNSAIHLTASPAQDIERRRLSLSGTTDWSPVSHDSAPGLYRYRLVRGDQYAWRATPDAPLLAVTRSIGVWLDDARQQATSEQLRRLVHHTGARALDASTQLGLPWPIRRALTLRTGLLPTPGEPPAGTALDRGTHHTYRNIDYDTAEQVGRILGRPLLH